MSDNPSPRVRFTEEPIEIPADVGTADTTGRADAANGAVVTFSGVVRNRNDGRDVLGIFYECYREMATQEATRLIAEIEGEFPVRVDRMAHRVGELLPGDVSLVVVIRSAHRRAAFDAMSTFVDRFKDRVPVWKKERYADDTASWL